MDPPREASDFADGGLELGRRLVEQFRLAGGAQLGDLEPHCQGHESLLGAVVEIALDTASFRISRLDYPQPRRPDLLELGPDLGCQPLVLERQPGGIPDRLDEARILGIDRRIVDEDAEELIVTVESGDYARGIRERELDREPRGIDEPGTGRRGECELQGRVIERPREDVAESAHRHPATELNDQVGDPAPAPARPQDPEQQADREDQGGAPPDDGAGRAVEEVDAGLIVELAAEDPQRSQHQP